MSAANASAASPSLQEEMRAHEPSMEEILASIRRIIADDESLASNVRERRRALGDEVEEPRSNARAAYPAPVLDLGPQELAESARSASAEVTPRAPAQVADIRQLRLNRAEPEPLAAEIVATAEPEAVEDDEIDELYDVAEPAPVVQESLLSADAASSVASHFEALTTSLFLNDSGLLEKYARDMMRPLLKQWLDDNLPMIVERLVRAEIERVARGGRR